MNYNVRISDNFLRGDHVDGEVLQHTDLNELENVAKTAINANYEDIQKLQNGETLAGNSEQLDGATLSKFATETLQNSDTKIPTSAQVKQYVDGEISNIDLSGYYTKREVDTTLSSNNLNLDANHKLEALSRTYEQYQTDGDTSFISKGTLDKVLLNKPIKYLIGTEGNPVNFNTLTAGFYKIEGDIIIGDADWYDVNNYFVVGPLNYENNKRIKRILNLAELTMYFVERTGTSPNYTYTLHDYNGYLVTQYDLTQIYDSIDDIASDVDNRLVDMEEELADMEVQIPTTLWEGTSTRPINLDTINAGFYELKGNVTIGGSTESFDFGTSGGAFSVGEWVDNKRKVTYLNHNWTYTIERTGTSPNYTYSLVYSDSDKAKGVPIVGNDLTNYVQFTDHATSNKPGVAIVNSYYGVDMSYSGALLGSTKTYAQYNNTNYFNDSGIICKGTLENVIIGKGLTTKSYVDGLVGDINSVLDAINGEVI